MGGRRNALSYKDLRHLSIDAEQLSINRKRPFYSTSYICHPCPTAAFRINERGPERRQFERDDLGVRQLRPYSHRESRAGIVPGLQASKGLFQIQSVKLLARIVPTGSAARAACRGGSQTAPVFNLT